MKRRFDHASNSNKNSGSSSYSTPQQPAKRPAPSHSQSYNNHELHSIGQQFRFRFDRRCMHNYQLKRIRNKIDVNPSRVRILHGDYNPSILDVGGNSCPSPHISWRSLPTNIFDSFSITSSTAFNLTTPPAPTKAIGASSSFSSAYQESEEASFPLLKSTFKCDFCDFSCSTSTTMQNHLASENHFCSSVYQEHPKQKSNLPPAASTPKRNNAIAEESRILALTVPRALINYQFCIRAGTISILCPTCYITLPDPYLCSYHHQIHHDRVGRYLLASVSHMFLGKAVAISKRPFKAAQCSQCSTKLSASSKLESGHQYNKSLKAHWKVSPTCSPFFLADKGHLVSEELVETNRLVVTIQCTFCSVMFCKYFATKPPIEKLHNLIIQFRGHLLAQHGAEETGDRSKSASLHVPHVFFISFSASNNKSRVIAPLSQRSSEEVVQYCLTQAKFLRSHLKSFIFVAKKPWLKRIDNEVVMLQECLTKK